MDQERFDRIARAVSSGASRRTVLGGAIAGLFGASVAAVTGVDAKKRGKKRKKAGAELQCEAINPCPGTRCCRSRPGSQNPTCEDPSNLLGTDTCGGPGEICRTCPPGTHCGFIAGVFKCVCDSSSCPDGCCINNFGAGDDQCHVNGSGVVESSNPAFDGRFVCGVGGSICQLCSIPGVDPLLQGCCTEDGVCRTGIQSNFCGNSGEICDSCPEGQECGIDQTCTGNVPPPPDVCPAGLTECPAGSGTCVNLSTNPSNCGACGVVCPGCRRRSRRRCDGGTCGCTKRRKKRKKRKK